MGIAHLRHSAHTGSGGGVSRSESCESVFRYLLGWIPADEPLLQFYYTWHSMIKRLTNVLAKEDKAVHILVLGLDNSGKSSLIQHIKPKKSQETATFEATPTVGFQTNKFRVNSLFIEWISYIGLSGEQPRHYLL